MSESGETLTRVNALCGRADLVRILADRPDDVSALTEFERKPTNKPGTANTIRSVSPAKGGTEVESTSTAPPRIEAGVTRPVAFWLASRYEGFGDEERLPETQPSVERVEWIPGVRGEQEPLAEWRELQPRLRNALTEVRPGREPDIEATVERISRGDWLGRNLPRKPRSGWGTRLRVILDRSDRLIPYWQDQLNVVAELSRRLPDYGFDVVPLQETVLDETLAGWAPPIPGELVLILGDVGALAADRGTTARRWMSFGQWLQKVRTRALVLMPSAVERCPDYLARFYEVVPWSRLDPLADISASGRTERVERLLRFCAAGIRLEPGLLRAIRKALGPDYSDAGLEADIWQHPSLAGRSASAGMIERNAARRLRAELDDEDGPTLLAVLEQVRSWHLRYGKNSEKLDFHRWLWIEELLHISTVAGNALDAEDSDWLRADLDNAGQEALLMSQDTRHPIDETEPGWREYIPQLAQRLQPGDVADDDARDAMHRMYASALGPDWQPDGGVDPSIGSDASKGPVRYYPVAQLGARLSIGGAYNGEAMLDQLEQADSTSFAGSPLFHVPSSDGLIRIESQDPFWRAGVAPPWAHRYGHDEFGAWATFLIPADGNESPEVAFRWIRSGRFLMGSPPEEAGRYEDEGPQHEVHVSHGFWMLEAPVTQLFWQTVMGDNPAEFKSPDRPVEHVSYDDCMQFCEKVNALVPDLVLTLPTEAQWEYACRAGTSGATYAAEGRDPTQVGQDSLDRIAWHGRNSMSAFELNNGHEPTWLESHSASDRAGSHPVRQKQPNRWGLYDTLGNVLEWCADGMRTYGSDVQQDIRGPVDDIGTRVLRGGSWIASANDMRAAYRDWSDVSTRNGIVGFRCIREATGAVPALRTAASQSKRKPVGAANAAYLNLLNKDQHHAAALPLTARARLTSDRARIDLVQITKPAWATAMGRDRFGFWAEFRLEPDKAVESESDAQVGAVVQRMRWCPPGEFLMGSPDFEEGRADGEGPRHLVRLSDGFWLFDTPCTQMMWTAVTGSNPSEFKSATRPVERVSWHEVQTFLLAINERVEGLHLRLPTEAQWEYACRAGTRTSTYLGNVQILGDANAPLLDSIAWYPGNSGVKFDLENAQSLAGLRSDFQYPESTEGGTHPVRLKRPNPWGLYDMLGNTWEWCHDGVRPYRNRPVVNPLGPTGERSRRAFRGGSWSNYARNVRAACRNGLEPTFSNAWLGFRCVGIQPDP